jgi:predicted TIM-barrel enzyme
MAFTRRQILERLPAETAIQAQMQAFKAVRFK